MDAHVYLVVERQNIGAGNWGELIWIFETMGTVDSKFPAWNNHSRTRLDGDAIIYESKFDTAEVSLEAFKQMLADEFGVDVGDIETVMTAADYAGIGTTIWQFNYSGQERFKVERFGTGGATWMESGDEARGYLALYRDLWEPEDL